MHVPAQLIPQPPQFALSLLVSTHAPLIHWANPELQLKPQLVPLHVAVALLGTEHAVQEVPHELMLMLSAHVVPHAWKAESHTKPQLAPLHVAVLALLGTGHGEQDEPHELTLVSSAHIVPHAWKPELHVKPQLVPLHVAEPCAGTEQGPTQTPPHNIWPLRQAH